MKKKKIRYLILTLLGLALIIGFVTYKKVINPEHRDIYTETTAFTLSAKELHSHFLENPEDATLKYANKVVETYGTVTEIETNLVVLEDKVHANFLEDNKQKIIVDDILKIKGRCIGFDEILLSVKIDQTTTVKIN